MEVSLRHAELVEVLQWQVDPAAVPVLRDITQEICELECDAEVHGLGSCLRLGGPKHRQHHRSDHRRRSVDVGAEVVVGGLARHL
jgi:hypothetical protein